MRIFSRQPRAGGAPSGHGRSLHFALVSALLMLVLLAGASTQCGRTDALCTGHFEQDFRELPPLSGTCGDCCGFRTG